MVNSDPWSETFSWRSTDDKKTQEREDMNKKIKHFYYP